VYSSSLPAWSSSGNSEFFSSLILNRGKFDQGPEWKRIDWEKGQQKLEK
jgi:hypothetical protein